MRQTTGTRKIPGEKLVNRSLWSLCQRVKTSAVRITLAESSVYNIDPTADGKEATILYANPRFTQIGSGRCGSSGCTSYAIVDGISFQTEGFKPVLVTVS